MKFRRRRAGAAREDVFINLASLIDVIFVLLLFFVVSTTFTRPEQLNIELPSALITTGRLLSPADSRCIAAIRVARSLLASACPFKA